MPGGQAGLDPRGQRVPLDKLGGDIKILAGLPAFVHGDDIGMPQLGGGFGLAQESLAIGVVVAGQPGHFQGDFAVEQRVVGPIDAAIRAGTEHATELEASDHARQWGPGIECSRGRIDGALVLAIVGGRCRTLIAHRTALYLPLPAIAKSVDHFVKLGTGVAHRLT